MQTLPIPYRCDDEGHSVIDECRRVTSSAVRTAFANAVDDDGNLLDEKAVRELVKKRFAGGVVDAWILHCAAREGLSMRGEHLAGKVIFGGKVAFEQRLNGNIDNKQWKASRLRPLTSFGDKQYAGNRHFKLSPDGRTCTFSMLMGGRQRGKKMTWRSVTLHLPHLHGNQGEVLRQAAALAAEKKINLTFRIDSEKLYVIVDPLDLPGHPERKNPIEEVPGRSIGIDLNPRWIGISCVENTKDPRRLDRTKALDWKLIALDHQVDAPKEVTSEVLAGACEAAIAMARQWGADTITVEKGLGKLRSSGKSKKNNQLLNYWARTKFVGMLRRKASLCGIKLVEVWGGYSTTIGNLWFELPDACASACEIARRGLAARMKIKDLFPVYDEGWTRRWKDVPLPAEVTGWKEVHRGLKAAKKFGYRRPHPKVVLSDPGAQETVPGLAVRRLCRRRRSGLIARPIGTGRPLQSSPVNRELLPQESTRKSG